MRTNGSPQQEVATSLFPFNFLVDSQTADTLALQQIHHDRQRQTRKTQ
jgi:hypothetical protein